MWNERGDRVSTIRFMNGSPVAYQEHGATGKATLTCDYSSRAMRSNSCPAFDDVRGGFRTIPSGEEPQVPQGADPGGS